MLSCAGDISIGLCVMNVELSSNNLRLSKLGVATIYESYERKGLIDLDLIQVIPGTCAAGPARTVLLGSGGNRAVHRVMKELEPGEVLVIASLEPGPIALIGELLAVQAQKRGASGILVDGAVRDLDSLKQLGLPIWARWIRAQAAGKNEESAIQVDVTIGGTVISPGDVVVLDSDGGVVIAKDDVASVLEAAEEREVREAIIHERLNEGEHTFDIYELEK